jgi:S1-C subfamily serine protease
VEWDDEGLGDESASPLLPPDDRLWRHPSEVAGAPARPATSVRGTVAPGGGPRMVTAVALTSCLSVLLTIGVVAALRPSAGEPVASGSGSATEPEAPAEPDVADLTSKLRPAIAKVVVRSAAGESSWGSGVLMRSDGLVLTSHHVVDGAAAVRVILDDGRDLVARIVGGDPDTDVAVLDLDGDDFPTAPLASGDAVARVGDPAVTIGAGPQVRVSMVSAMHQDAGAGGHRFLDVMRTDRAVEPGCSGGAVVDRDGNVIGIAVAEDLATPIDVARSVATQLLGSGKVVRGWLGIDGETHEDGAIVRSVKGDSPAERAGLLAGDVIVAIDGAAVASMSAVVVRVRSLAPGAAVTLRVERDGTRLDVPVTLAEKPIPS